VSEHLRLALHKEIPETAAFREAWEKLVFSMTAPEVFYTWEWAAAVSRAYAASMQPLLFAAYRDHELRGIAVLALDAERRVSFLAGTTADYCDFVSSAVERRELVQLVFSELRQMGISDVFLTNIPADSPTLQVLRSSARAFGFFSFSRPAYWCSLVILRSEAQRQKVSRSAARKARRYANACESGQIEIGHAADQDWLASGFPVFAAAHVGRFLQGGRLSNLVRSERRVFLQELSRLLSHRGWLAISRLSHGGTPLAWNYGLKFAGKWFWYQPAFKVQAAELSPGSLLLCRILEQACAEPDTHTVDLGLGDEEYKSRYSNHGRQTLAFVASRSSAKLAFQICRHQASRALKKSPMMERHARICRDRLSVVRRCGLHAAPIRAWSRIRSLFAPCEVAFFDLAALPPVELPAGFLLEPASIELLAQAAMNYEKNPETLDYLLRSAPRLTSGVEGFALMNHLREAVHFAWVAPFKDFEMAELQQKLHEPAPNSMLLFDCRTPEPQRGRGYYGLSVSLIAYALRQRNQRPWIFSASTNRSSLRGLERAGATCSFSLVRRPGLFGARVLISEAEARPAPALDLYPVA